MTSPPRIRPAQDEDAPAISALLDELGHPLAPAAVRTQLDRLRAWSQCFTLVAVARGEVVGLVSGFATPVLHRERPVGRISALVVRGSEAGRGIGTQLLRAAERSLEDLGCARLEVTSAEHREAAHRFYLARGYRKQGLRFSREIP
jgi:GNAT superfamily N-acetyltransferase